MEDGSKNKKTLTGLAARLGRLPSDKKRAALEMSAALAGVSLRVSREFVEAVPRAAKLLSAEDLRLSLAKANIEARPIWKPMNLQPIYADARAFVDGTGERLFRTGLSLPSGSVLDGNAVERVTGTIASLLEGARAA